MTATGDPPHVNLEQWQAATARAAPLIGAVVLVWAAFELLLNEEVRWWRMKNIGNGAPFPPDMKLSQRFRDRLKEFVQSFEHMGVKDEAEVFEAEATRLALIRNNLAHNIAALWIDEAGILHAFTVNENRGFQKELNAWRANRNGPRPEPTNKATYTDAEMSQTVSQIQGMISKLQVLRHKAEQVNMPGKLRAVRLLPR